MVGGASEQYERVTWYGYKRDPTPVAVGCHRVHARRPRPQTVPRHGPPSGSVVGARPYIYIYIYNNNNTEQLVFIPFPSPVIYIL